MQFAEVTNDIAFKKIFGNEKKKNILISFLNAVLDFKDEMLITDVELANPYQVPKIEELKETILDIKAINKSGEHFIVEMQKNNKGDFAKRSLFYTSKAYVSQLGKGYKYRTLKKVYFIGILNFTLFEGQDFITRHLILNKQTLKQELKDFEFTFIELDKFDIELTQLKTILEKWIYFIKNASNFTMVPKEYKEKEFLDAFESATQYAWDKKELEIYDYVGLREYDKINELETAIEQGMKKGLEQGMQKGLEQGLEQGMQEGVKNVAISLLDILDDETIASKTGLSIEFIKSLRTQNRA